MVDVCGMLWTVLGFISFEEIGAIIARKGKGGNVGLVHPFLLVNQHSHRLPFLAMIPV